MFATVAIVGGLLLIYLVILDYFYILVVDMLNFPCYGLVLCFFGKCSLFVTLDIVRGLT